MKPIKLSKKMNAHHVPLRQIVAKIRLEKKRRRSIKRRRGVVKFIFSIIKKRRCSVTILPFALA